jgi:hypothetical protein
VNPKFFRVSTKAVFTIADSNLKFITVIDKCWRFCSCMEEDLPPSSTPQQ